MRRGFQLLEALVVIGILGILMALLIPAIGAVRESSRRAECIGHLRQIGIALQNYHEANSVFPPGYVDGAANNSSGFGWSSMLLPYLDQKPLYEAMNFDRAVTSTANETACRTVLDVFLCPSDPTATSDPRGTATCNTVACAGAGGDDGIFFWNSSIRKADVKDGLGNTFAASERTFRLRPSYWSGVRSGDSSDVLFTTAKNPEAGPESVSSAHVGIINMLMSDGSTREIEKSMDAQAFRAFGTRRGGEMVQ